MADYTNAFRKLQAYLVTDVPLAGITADQIKGFLGDLSTPRAPNGATKRPVKGLSNKTILNIHTTLSALRTWAAAEGIVTQHLLRKIPRPKPEKRAITPFSEEDIKTLLANGERSRAYTRPGKRACDHAVATALRNRTIILLLLDTCQMPPGVSGAVTQGGVGVRSSEQRRIRLPSPPALSSPGRREWR